MITANIADNSPLWRWRPNSISGQSGSGVWSVENNIQFGLLTWSWGGLGAGQQTSEIFRQARERSVRGIERIEGLIEVGTRVTNLQDIPQAERLRDEIVIENGFYSQTGITDLDIWHDPNAPDDPEEPEDPEDPEEPGEQLNASEKRVVDAMRAVNEDYDTLVDIVVGILSLGK